MRQTWSTFGNACVLRSMNGRGSQWPRHTEQTKPEVETVDLYVRTIPIRKPWAYPLADRCRYCVAHLSDRRADSWQVVRGPAQLAHASACRTHVNRT